MSNQVRVIARVSAEAAARLDEMVKYMPAGSNASRNSVGGALLEQAVMGQSARASLARGAVMAGDLPGTPVASYGAPPLPQGPSRSAQSRIEGAMGIAGMMSSAAVDTLLGLARGTTGLARKGAVALDVAGGGALLAWVEEQERATATRKRE